MTPELCIKLMVVLPILACVFGYLMYRFAQNDDDDWRNLLCHFLCLVLFVSLFMGSLAAFIEGIPYLKYHDKVGQTVAVVEIAAMKNSSAVSGSFFLGSGRINQTEYYYYLKKPPGGGVQIERVRAFGTTVYEKNNETPRVEEYIYTTTGKTAYRIFVPEGSILFEYNVQLP